MGFRGVRGIFQGYQEFSRAFHGSLQGCNRFQGCSRRLQGFSKYSGVFRVISLTFQRGFRGVLGRSKDVPESFRDDIGVLKEF